MSDLGILFLYYICELLYCACLEYTLSLLFRKERTTSMSGSKADASDSFNDYWESVNDAWECGDDEFNNIAGASFILLFIYLSRITFLFSIKRF